MAFQRETFNLIREKRCSGGMSSIFAMRIKCLNEKNVALGSYFWRKEGMKFMPSKIL